MVWKPAIWNQFSILSASLSEAALGFTLISISSTYATLLCQGISTHFVIRYVVYLLQLWWFVTCFFSSTKQDPSSLPFIHPFIHLFIHSFILSSLMNQHRFSAPIFFPAFLSCKSDTYALPVHFLRHRPHGVLLLCCVGNLPLHSVIRWYKCSWLCPVVVCDKFQHAIIHRWYAYPSACNLFFPAFISLHSWKVHLISVLESSFLWE